MDNLDGVSTCGFHLNTSSFPWSDQYFCLVSTIYESIFLEHLNKLVVEPIDDILIFSMFKDIHIGHLALVFETC
jgi:hypothetical protein